MSKVIVKAPVSVLSLSAAAILVAFVGGLTGRIWLVPVGVALIFATEMVVLYRWRKRIAPDVQAARQPGRPAPYVEVKWPRSARRFAGV
jgi:hypothetical protein